MREMFLFAKFLAGIVLVLINMCFLLGLILIAGCENKPVNNASYKQGDIVNFKLSGKKAMIDHVDYYSETPSYSVKYLNENGDYKKDTVYEYELEKPIVAEKALGEPE